MKKYSKEQIENTIASSPDLISALEAVGAMYGIPSSNFLVSEKANGIKIINDNIIAPDIKNTKANTGSIVCAVGAVLDYISQRIDDKLNDFQSSSIEKSKLDEAIAKGDPSKGTVIKRYETDDGAEILIYDTGKVDRPLTASAIRKVGELRKSGEIPLINDDAPSKTKLSYFSDADDVMNGVPPTTSSEVPETDVANSVNESALVLDLISEYNNTTHLGYDIFSEMGFDIKQADSIITESAKGSKKAKAIKPEDIKHMKFDNKHIIKAIKYFNKAREEQSDVKNAKELNIKTLVNSSNFSNGIRELEQQFDCHISFKFEKSDPDSANVFTFIHDKEIEYKHDITISKSKGFQLHGMGIWIVVDDTGLMMSAPDNPALFGQSITSIILHEIFHNITDAIRVYNDTFLVNTATTVAFLQSARSAKAKHKIIDKYIESIGLSHDIRFNNPVAKRIFIKNLLLLSSLQDKADINKVIDVTSSNESESDIDSVIKYYKDFVSKRKKQKSRKRNITIPTVGSLISVISTVVTTHLGMGPLALLSFAVSGGFVASLFGKGVFRTVDDKLSEAYKNGTAYEESWCDMFAGMYNLPVLFNIGQGANVKTTFTANSVHNVDKLNELAKLEKELFSLLYIAYPSNSERNHAAAKLAENALKQKNIDPATKKYLTWIKDNYSDMLKTDIETEGINATYDPNRADDVDKHINDIINQGNVTVTESFV